MSVQLSIGTLSDADLWNLKQALTGAQAPIVTPTPAPQPAPQPTGGRVINLKLDWGVAGSGNKRVFTSGFTGNDVVVVQFTTPVGMFSNGQIGALQAAESRSVAISRTACLSRSPGVFDDNSLAPDGFFAQKATAKGNTVTVAFVIGGQPATYPVLQPNTTYYFNIKNTNGVGGDMVIELIKPPGL